jgi:hypothetical protein
MAADRPASLVLRSSFWSKPALASVWTSAVRMLLSSELTAAVPLAAVSVDAFFGRAMRVLPCLLSDANEFRAEDLKPSGATRDGEDLLARCHEVIGKAGAHLRHRNRLAGVGPHRLDNGGLQIVLGAISTDAEAPALIALDARCAEEEEFKLTPAPCTAGEAGALVRLVETEMLLL